MSIAAQKKRSLLWQSVAMQLADAEIILSSVKLKDADAAEIAAVAALIEAQRLVKELLS